MNNLDIFEQAQQELLTVSDCIRFALSLFQRSDLYYGHGTESSLDDAVALVLGSLNLPPDLDALYFPTRLLRSEVAIVINNIQKRITTREPVAYLINESYFCGMPFYVDPRVLIPRSPVAELIEEGFSPWIERDLIERILDVGTGSGCIAIACAVHIPQAAVEAIDIDSDALEVAKKNIALYGLEKELRLIQSDLFSGLKEDDRFDIIISNPPYVPSPSMKTLPQEYLHEPHLALDGGEDGLIFVNHMLKQASKHLTPHGILIIEVGEAQQFLIEKYPLVPFTWLQFTHGGDGVFLLTKQELDDCEEYFQ